ncbi:pancreatic secretory granule membrane major glycoprotein GP2-like [Mixophyes fleayi]|uniref:pancreatic secretory granule membrane major glycoprotein GP2-like n=1 Tax=Mixophyes fleayi TaxID=3061075 RepID=UPI003F4E07C2
MSVRHFKNNKTHVIFKNTIYISMDSSFVGEIMVNIDFSCVYPLDMQLSLETAVMPFSSSIVVSVEGTGDQLVTMAFFQDSSYKTPYEGSEVLLTSKTILYVGVMLKSAASSQFYVLMRNCYATGSMNASTSAKYDIIKNSCRSQQDSTINVISNGKSPNGQFSVQLFGYVKDLYVVYLHCDIHLCNYTNEMCTPVISCLERAGESIYGDEVGDVGSSEVGVNLVHEGEEFEDLVGEE